MSESKKRKELIAELHGKAKLTLLEVATRMYSEYGKGVLEISADNVSWRVLPHLNRTEEILVENVDFENEFVMTACINEESTTTRVVGKKEELMTTVVTIDRSDFQ